METLYKEKKISSQERTRNNGFKLESFKLRKGISKGWNYDTVDKWSKLPSEFINADKLASCKHRWDLIQ